MADPEEQIEEPKVVEETQDAETVQDEPVQEETTDDKTNEQTTEEGEATTEQTVDEASTEPKEEDADAGEQPQVIDSEVQEEVTGETSAEAEAEDDKEPTDEEETRQEQLEGEEDAQTTAPPPTAEAQSTSPQPLLMREATEEAIQEEAETEQVGEGSKPNSPVEKPPSVRAQGERPSTAGSTGSYVESSSNALSLTWSFGVNKSVPSINLTNHLRKMVVYTTGHTAVLYNYQKNTQRLLQGHSNNITYICASRDKRWVATADKGDNSMVIVWDTYTGTPVQTIFEAHENGVVSMAMTPDAKYLVTLGTTPNQCISIWDWTTDGETPVCSMQLSNSYGQQHYVHFNPEDTSQIVSNSDSQVIFYSWKGSKIEHVAPLLTDQDFNRMVGHFSQSIFCSNSTRAFTATSVGNVVVWDNNRPISGPALLEPSPNKKAFKLVRVQERGITVLTTTDQYVVTGDVNGHVKFYDLQLRMSNWYNEFDVGPLNSVSFAYVSDFVPEVKEDSDYPPDATIDAKSFVTRDYTIGTFNAQVALIVADGTEVKMIQDEHDAAIHALATHPNQSHVAIGSYSGLLKVWNYKSKTLVASRNFPKGHLIRCMAYDPKGNYLGIGFTNGCVRILDAISLEEECDDPFRYSRDAVTLCTFSHDSKWMAVADADHCVTLFKAQHPSTGMTWDYLGKHRAHYKPIRDLSFGVALDSDNPRLLSVGEDRALIEYDIFNSGKDDLKLLGIERIEQSAVPQCLVWYPAITKEQFFLSANDQFKFKLFNTTTKMCRKTVLGPTYGSPVQKMQVLPTKDPVHDKRYLSYITSDKVGMHIMPLDGNPHNAMALIAHPSGVTNLACSHDGRYMFTSGGTDSTVLMWTISIVALEAASRLGGEDLIPFYGLLEGGREGELFRELENYFYYAQIRSQGVDTTDSRQVSIKIPLTEIPFVMRAMGHYPSEQEIDDMVNEVKFSEYVDTGKYISEINLGDFIKLYVNHRPAFGLSEAKLQWAFDVLGFDEGMDQPVIERGELLHLLQNKGEHMTEAAVAEYLTTLLGYNPEGGSSELGSFDPTGAGDILEDSLPELISADMFAGEVLGFGGMENMEQQSASVME
ncbi:cilia- and flagella-associated protein 251-like isoform X2 [Asterias rubens]|uniref:cilia- and flagella-associated protein 251-like isoform X2 n=1 Tax=Asterias rubens TaxID=7604 RepID=UPI0014559A06|nr:cilia- and flagella-associated protein 251-like isoform X2 [Asterias rubens]